MSDAPAPGASRRISAEEGRSLLARVKRFQLIERLSGLAMLVSIPVFALSYFQLRAIDQAAKGGGVRAIPWLAWVAVAVFVAGFGLMRLAKTMIGRDHRVLTAEDHARKMESLDAEFEARDATDGKGRLE
jgi:hypothetical protein